MEKLSEGQKEVLRKMVNFQCEMCHKHQLEVGKLIPHRITRGNKGGKYIPSNIKMICSKCHKLVHYGEF